MKRAVLYLRVSTLDQTTANQERELREIAARIGYDIFRVYKDHGISGAKGRDKRPAFDALCRDATKRQFDVIMAWSVDRLGRSLQDLVDFLSEIHALRIDLYLHQQGLDTTTPAGKAMFGVMGVFAEFQRAIPDRTERAVQAALRKKGRPGMRKIASDLGVGVGTVQRIGRELNQGVADVCFAPESGQIADI
jgi:DNA invertase Pin-like site-specific DNA recombinase